MRRAVIYIRVSTEKQADKASPHAQEAECRAWCEKNGYQVIEVYREVEKYRVGGKMVEPSGTRSDRPQLNRMLADADAGLFDVIVAWREDRLYRGLRPMLHVIDCYKRNGLLIELVNETFDPNMAQIKAAIAGMELDAIKERHRMGRQARAETGKVLNSYTIPYGYVAKDGWAKINPDEARWVVQINEWYADGIGLNEIRRRLIMAGAPQRNHPSREKGKVRVDWANTIVQRITRYAPYSTGKQPVTIGGRTYDVNVPVLLDADLAERVAARRAKTKQHPAHHKKYNYLVDGLAYCEGCGVKLQAKSRVRPYGIELSYCCKYHDVGYVKGEGANCCKYNSVRLIDQAVWDKVKAVLSDDVLFESRVRAKIDELRLKEQDAEAEVDRMQKQLDDLSIERQRIILWARKGSISEDDMALQLGGLDMEANAIKKQMQESSLLLDNRAERLLAFANRYRARLKGGAAFLSIELCTPEEAEEQFKLRREIVDAIVSRVEITADKQPIVYFEFDLRDVMSELAVSASSEPAQPEYIKTQSLVRSYGGGRGTVARGSSAHPMGVCPRLSKCA